jgi:signal transduction histidine kinase
MKVIARFAFAFFLATCVCLAALAFQHARSEVKDLRETSAADLRAFGEGLREGVAQVWERSGDARAIEVIQAASGRRGDLDVSWQPVAGGLPSQPSDPQVIALDVPLVVRGEMVGTLRLHRRIAAEQDVLRASLREELTGAGVLAACFGGLVVVLGGALIGRPLQRMVTHSSRIGAGDLETRLDARRHDEIGELERAMNTMSEELARARDRAERESTARVEALEQLRHLDRLRMVGTIASSLAHELGTPLNVLLLRGHSIADGEIAPAEMAETGRTITAQVEKMSRLVRQILDFSRRAPARGDVELTGVARDAAGLLGTLAKKANVTISVDVASDAVVLGERIQLEQAVTNLVVNAIHAMPKGGPLELRVGTVDDARASENTAPVRAGFIEVRDEGVGIEPAELTRIFEPFYTTRPEGAGTGLGLSVARGIAEDHGGWIAAESEPGRGSAFTIYVPTREARS